MNRRSTRHPRYAPAGPCAGRRRSRGPCHVSWTRALQAVLVLGLALVAKPLLAEDTEQVFADWKDRVVQIQLVDLAAGSKAGIGSGFFVGRNDWVVSNYHVIAGLVNEPGTYTARYVADDGTEGTLELLAVDVVHDLALLKTDGLMRLPLGVTAALPPKGTRLWSMGYPFDIGLTIVEGTFNGHWQNTLYEKLHFTGSVNQGMSGGPTLDAAGNVIGVNVMGGFNQVSFLVPVRHVVNLLATAYEEPPGQGPLEAMVAAQLLENQQDLADRTLSDALPVTRLGDYEVPSALADFINCWGGSEDDVENRLNLVYYTCQTRDQIFLSNSLSTGSISYQHDIVSSDALGPLRFWRQLENRGYYPRLGHDGDERSVSNFHCQAGFVAGDGVPMKVTYCVRGYLKVEGLFDGYLSATSLVEDDQALQTTLTASGFSWDNLQRLTGAFLDSVRWDP